MILGNQILELRKRKNVTQEALAAALGVTAAAVSKWENNYTLPDVLMLCAIADFFDVTTDELLGRLKEGKRAVIAAETQALAEKIKALAAHCGIATEGIYSNCQDASAAVRSDGRINYLLAGFRKHDFSELEFDLGPRAINLYVSFGETEEDILGDLRSALQNNG